MTPEQEQQISSIVTRIHMLRADNRADEDIRLALIMEGWAAAAIDEALKRTP